MVTLLLAEEVQEPEIESEINQIEVHQWHYRVPFPGVRYYSYQQEPSPVGEADPWALDVVPARVSVQCS